MITDISFELRGFFQRLEELIEVAQESLAKDRTFTFLVVLFSGIDALASIEEGHASKPAFRRWVERYLFSGSWKPCTADDLYGARCGVLHTFAADSDLSRAGLIVPVWYTHGNIPAGCLRETMQQLGHEVRAINTAEFLKAFLIGVQSFLDDVKQDEALQDKVVEATKGWFYQWDA